jgi:hypothetical protein
MLETLSQGKGLQIDIGIEINIEKIDINIAIEYLFNVSIFHIDIESISMFEIQYIGKVVIIFSMSLCYSIFVSILKFDNFGHIGSQLFRKH